MERHFIELKEENWKFALGIQNTVRLGSKWARVDPDDQLIFICPDAPSKIVAAEVRTVTKGFFCDLAEDDRFFNHHAGYKTQELLDALQFAYGAGEVDESSLVTVIEFELL